MAPNYDNLVRSDRVIMSDCCLVCPYFILQALEFGMIGINNAGLSAATTPFGGMKESGIGREGGHWGLEEYLEVKYVGIGYDP